jgi:hypothetical protein
MTNLTGLKLKGFAVWLRRLTDDEVFIVLDQRYESYERYRGLRWEMYYDLTLSEALFRGIICPKI